MSTGLLLILLILALAALALVILVAGRALRNFLRFRGTRVIGLICVCGSVPAGRNGATAARNACPRSRPLRRAA
jgi:hypothetical protein